MKRSLLVLVLLFAGCAMSGPKREVSNKVDCSKAVNKKFKQCQGKWKEHYHHGGESR
jgi:hypothetical protein